MVPNEETEIVAAMHQAIGRLLERVSRDRESLTLSRHREAQTGINHLNALAAAADELMRALDGDVGARQDT